MVAEVSTFTDRVNVLGETKSGEKLLPAYDHTGLGDCFADASNLITQLLNELTIGPQYLVEMKNDTVAFTTDVPDEFLTEYVDFYLIINTVQPTDDWQQSLLTAAKLASRDTVEILVERSLPGVGLISLPVAPPGLPKRVNSYYLKVDIHDEQWNSVKREENVALLWDDSPEDATVELVVVRK